jgi:hypothetical protein
MSGLTVGVLAVNAVVAPIAGVLTLVDLVTDPKGATERIDASMTDRQKNC